MWRVDGHNYLRFLELLSPLSIHRYCKALVPFPNWLLPSLPTVQKCSVILNFSPYPLKQSVLPSTYLSNVCPALSPHCPVLVQKPLATALINRNSLLGAQAPSMQIPLHNVVSLPSPLVEHFNYFPVPGAQSCLVCGPGLPLPFTYPHPHLISYLSGSWAPTSNTSHSLCSPELCTRHSYCRGHTYSATSLANSYLSLIVRHPCPKAEQCEKTTVIIRALIAPLWHFFPTRESVILR